MIKDEIIFLKHVIGKSGVYLISDVIEFYLFFLGYSIGNSAKSEELNEFFDEFTAFLQKDFETKEKLQWYKLIQMRSSTKYHSLELLRKTFNEFLESRENLDA
ncbi:hypothetical protein KYG33_06820 [Chryseobacterium sp. D764]|uniref:hypothetical protein n=1 Tax=Chryseobacterium sp. D764 TaxID=2856522 RepID=UPI001C593E02|nr:hypothetical protein [Chryseobacterium sp. D764]QXU50745.1 hypothetical protein KYG33_06820 [Chryseobacterium sp. D764]